MVMLLPIYLRTVSSNSSQIKNRYRPLRQSVIIVPATQTTAKAMPARMTCLKSPATIQPPADHINQRTARHNTAVDALLVWEMRVPRAIIVPKSGSHANLARNEIIEASTPCIRHAASWNVLNG